MADYRNYIPINYKIHLEIDVNSSVFKGNTEIVLKCVKETNRIILDIEGLKINSTQIFQDGKLIESSFKENNEKKELLIDSLKVLKNHLILKFEFEGEYNSDLLGMYRSKYKYKDQENYVVATQFEEIYARRVFPCFDHPSKKATFEVEFLIDKRLKAFSNTSIKKIIEREDNKKLVIFEKTPKMCTYLLFFGVGDFEIAEIKTDKHHVRLIATPEKTKYGKLGKEVALKSLEFCEEYTAQKYPLSKCDLLAIPDFPFGAMENWGAITFRENLLLIYPGKTSKQGIFNVISVIAHEVAHFWFGDLVSPIDWKYIWLNESFASFFTYAIPDHYYPHWHSWEYFIIHYYMSSLERDGLIETFPVEFLGEEDIFITPAKVGIIYNKGASILRMLVGYIGENNFKKGISYFMDKFKFENANTEQYWEAIEEATGKPIKDFADSWIHQPGYPYLEVNIVKNELKLTQQKFNYLRSDSDSKWLIPCNLKIFYRDGSSEDMIQVFNNNFHKITLPEKILTVKININQTGFYRVKYDDNHLQELGKLIKNKQLSAIDRYGIENDYFAFVKKGIYHFDDYLQFIEEFYSEEEEYLPLISIFSNLTYSHILLESKRDKISQLGIKISERFFDKFRYEPLENEDMRISILRNYLLWVSFSFGSQKVKDFGKNKFQEVINGEVISPDILSSILKIGAVTYSNSMEYFSLKIESSETPEIEKLYIYEAMGCFRNEADILNALQFAILKIPPQTWYALFYRLAQNINALDYLWPWFTKNLNLLEKRSPFVLARTIASFIPLGGIKFKKEILEFFQTYKKQNEFQKDTIDMALEELEINVIFKNFE